MPWTIHNADGRLLVSGGGTGLTNPLEADLDAAGYQILNHVLHKSAVEPTGVEGKIYYDTDDDHVWVATE